MASESIPNARCPPATGGGAPSADGPGVRSGRVRLTVKSYRSRTKAMVRIVRLPCRCPPASTPSHRSARSAHGPSSSLVPAGTPPDRLGSRPGGHAGLAADQDRRDQRGRRQAGGLPPVRGSGRRGAAPDRGRSGCRLSAGVGVDGFSRQLQIAATAGADGFMAGRAVRGDAVGCDDEVARRAGAILACERLDVLGEIVTTSGRPVRVPLSFSETMDVLGPDWHRECRG